MHPIKPNSMSPYVPLRVYSVFSQGKGAVDAASLAAVMERAGLPYLPVCDPMALTGWERFKKEADNRGLKPVLGTEIILPEKGSLLLFPLSQAGYLSLVSCLNQRRLPALQEVLAVFLPLRPDAVFLHRLRRKVGPENFYLGLEWQSGQWLREWSLGSGIPLVWAQALRWTANAQKYAVARAVFQHLPLPETLQNDAGLGDYARPPVGLKGDVDGSDAAVWQQIQQARTVGCFQLESPLSRENLLNARPANLAELAIAVAIIRPGPARSGMKAAYLERRPPCHPLLGQLFPASRGALIFEEQITVLLHRVSGWSLEQAEMARKEFKKKKGEARRSDFFERGQKNGWSHGELELFWKLALDFSLYAFCQAHSLAYAYAAYLSAWLKTKQPLNFFCRLLNAAGGYYQLPDYIAEAKGWGLTVLAPDVNRSGLGFTAEQGAIRSGLLAVKGIGVKLATRVVENRGHGYMSLEDLLVRTRLNERGLSMLLAVSALQSLGRDGFSLPEKRNNWQKYLGFQPSEKA